ncbi:heptyl-3-hydroxy-4(1H)-quinolone synthase [Seminavis robusta]|uniref:Heptyl-3-hydroxy-4(1H)-quinolone synthase n=1 Tax=Seminavis robusta TaxID=568900 RepID=A0A9N8HVF6_9STRA|nr:heptyl-3-hydroxy-4(1H)-quinolone synthase [Seminavis robusta]|eukprot:Sro1499_g277770.1 heptyl-3-hydroxy-4(1H)-quinolone synthase (491) ;mRNA; f:13328-14800
MPTAETAKEDGDGGKDHPIVIAGAGPCGLVAALVLQRHGIPIVILEKASRDKLDASVGSGYDLSPTTIEIVQKRLGLDTTKVFIQYSAFQCRTLEGKVVRDIEFPKALDPSKSYQQATRPGLQGLLLDQLVDQEKVLKCGVGVESYQEDVEKGVVTVHLVDGTTVVGKALLACDGIHSKVRKCMHGGDDVDPLSYCGTTCYWSVSPKPTPGSALESAINETQSFRQEGPSFVWGMGSHRAPGSFFVTPNNNGQGVWMLGLKEEDQPAANVSDDLRRRGGAIMTEESKQALLDMLKQRSRDHDASMIEIIRATPEITQAGLFDRANQDLPFSSPGKLVALLGDAAHPQSPYLGQGCNMAVTDGYVCATLLARHSSVAKAVETYDCEQRRKEIQHVVKEARNATDYCVSSSLWNYWFFYNLMKYAPMDSNVIMDNLIQHDKSNVSCLRRLDGVEDEKLSKLSDISTNWVKVAIVVLVAVGASMVLKGKLAAV